MRGSPLAATAVLTALLVACSGEEDLPSAVTVQATDALRFDPADTELAVGGQVTWQFGSVAHNVVFTSGAQPPDDIATLTANASVTRIFPTGGTYTYVCEVHPGMAGRVVVSEQAEPFDPY